MTAQPIGPRPVTAPGWYTGSPTYNSSYLLAGVRTGLFVLVLVAFFAVIVLF